MPETEPTKSNAPSPAGPTTVNGDQRLRAQKLADRLDLSGFTGVQIGMRATEYGVLLITLMGRRPERSFIYTFSAMASEQLDHVLQLLEEIVTNEEKLAQYDREAAETKRPRFSIAAFTSTLVLLTALSLLDLESADIWRFLSTVLAATFCGFFTFERRRR
jgi:hypothetical protein